MAPSIHPRGAASPSVVLLAVLVAFLLHRIYFELTTVARRRRMIREHGCRPVQRYQHKGVGGNLIGLDVIKGMIKAGKEGRLMEHTRIENFSNRRHTVQLNLLDKRSKPAAPNSQASPESSTVINTEEPENVKAMLATQFKDFALPKARNDLLVPLFGHGIFDTDGHAWERSRALIRPNFARQQVADLDMFEKHILHLIDGIPRDGSAVDLQDLFFGLTMDSATEFLFGRSTNVLAPGLETKSASNFVKAFVYATEAVSMTFQTGGLSNWIPDPKWHRSIKTIHSFADDIVREALSARQNGAFKKDGKKYTFLHELISRTQNPYTLRSELLNVLLAGRDTTAGLLTNTWHVLSKRHDVWAKLKAEVDTLNGEKPDYSSIKELKYLKYLLKESLRLMPVVPVNSREAVCDTVLPVGGGKDGKSPIFIPKGQTVGYSSWSMHRRTDYYGDNALEFKPERWETLRPGWEYLPFSGGPRICVGQQYALLEASYTTIRLAQHFSRVESRDERQWREWLAITLASGVGCKVALCEE